jgi:hypothetical protein
MKANIKLKEYLEFIQSKKFDIEKFYNEYMHYFYGKWNEKNTQIFHTLIPQAFVTHTPTKL